MNHPNRSRSNPARNPTPDEIMQARESAGLNMSQAARLIYCARDTWSKWESGDRRMHPAFWQLFKIKLDNELNQQNH